MQAQSEKVKYPENLPLKKLVQQSGLKIGYLAGRLGVSRLILSHTINGHYKGSNIVPRLKQIIKESK